MKISRVLGAALLIGTTFFAAAADLTFDLKINRGAAKDYNPENQKTNIAVFVIDCSGSMIMPYPQVPAWSREKYVRMKLLPDQFEALPPGTEAFVYLYSVFDDKEDWKTIKHKILASQGIKDAFLKELQDEIEKRVKLKGATPYFDTMALVLDKIKKDWLDDPNVNLWLFDYTDGKNETNGFFPNDFRYQSHRDNPRLLEVAAKKFSRDYGACLRQIKNDKKRLFYLPLNVGTEEERPNFNRTPEYKVNFYLKKTSLKNPQDAPSQIVPLSADFGVDQECWKLLQNDPCTVRIQFNDGKFQSYRVSLGKSQNQIKVNVPDGANKVTVFFDCPEGRQGKFTLIPPGAPVIIRLPPADPKKAGIELVTVQDKVLNANAPLTVRKDKPVYFAAEGSAKKYIWRIFEDKTLVFNKKSEAGESVKYIFTKTGRYSFEVVAEGAVGPNSKKQGIIDVFEIGLDIRNQGDKISLPERWEERIEAKLDKGKGMLQPSRLDWEVIGPFTGKEKEIPEMTSLDSHQLRSRHFFRSAGKYKIRVTAVYDRLPGETVTKETSWEVSMPGTIVFSKSMKGKGAGFEFGQPVELSIEMTGKIDPKSIVWKANGKEIARRTPKYVHTHPDKTKKVVFTVQAFDRVTKQMRELSIDYKFGCSISQPVLKIVDRKTGKGIWGVGADVDFEVVSAEKYDQISFTFDDDPTPVPAVNGHVIRKAAKGGALKYKMTCICRKCGEKFEDEKTIATQAKNPHPVLEVKGNRIRFSKGDFVTLQDNGDKEGDYVYCRLEKKNSKGEYEELDILEKGFRKKQITMGERDFPVPPANWADYTLRLVPLNGNKEDITQYQGKKVYPSVLKICVRPPLWVSLLILAIGIAFFIFLICLMKKFLFGNGPCAWTLRVMASPKFPENQKEITRFADLLVNESDRRLGDYWSVWTLGEKRATIPLGEFSSGNVGSDDYLTIDSDGMIDFHGGFKLIPNRILREDNTRQTSKIYESRNSKKKNYLYLLLDRNETDTHYEIWFYVLCFFSLAVVAVAAYCLLLL